MTNAMPFENAGNRIFYLSKKIKNRDQEEKEELNRKKKLPQKLPAINTRLSVWSQAYRSISRFYELNFSRDSYYCLVEQPENFIRVGICLFHFSKCVGIDVND